jgi:rhomboid protease GluP
MTERATAEVCRRLLGALDAPGADPAARPALVEIEKDTLWLQLPKGNLVLLEMVDEGARREDLEVRFKALANQRKQAASTTHVVAVGDGVTIERSLEAARPFYAVAATGFYQLDTAGTLRHVAGGKLAELERAAAVLPDVPALTPGRFEELLARGRAQRQEHAQFARNLGARMYVTTALMVVSSALFGLSYLWGHGEMGASLLRMGANNGAAVRAGEVFRLLSSAFLHANLVHLLFNGIALWMFGTLFEAVLGPRRFLVLYGLSALGGSIASAVLGPFALSVGASGAIWGLMAAAVGLAIRPRGLLPPFVTSQLRSRGWAPLLLNVAYSFQPGIDLYAHAGGCVVGLALVGSGVLTRGLEPVHTRTRPPDEGNWRSPQSVGALVVAACMAASIATALAVGRPWLPAR